MEQQALDVGGEPAKQPSLDKKPPNRPSLLHSILAWRRGFKINRERSKAADWAMVVLTFFTLVAAIVSAVYFQKQLIEARRSTDAAIKNFMLDERAWVQADVRVSQYTDVSGKYIKYAVGAKNVGKTVASNIVMTVHNISGDQIDIKNIPSYQEPEPVQQGNAVRVPIIAPNSAAIETVDYPIYKDQIAHSTTKRDYIIGRIAYDDQFHVAHWVKYCFIVRIDIPQLEGCGMNGSANQADDNPEPIPNRE